jgi:hypothetical protein
MKNGATEHPIKLSPGYTVGDAFLKTLAEAQAEAIKNLLPMPNGVEGLKTIDEFVRAIVSNADAVVAILNPPKELRQRKPRSARGTKRKNAAALATQRAEATAALDKAMSI